MADPQSRNEPPISSIGSLTSREFIFAMWNSGTTRTLLCVAGLHQAWTHVPFF